MLLAVALGGAVGSVARWWIGGLAQPSATGGFPYSTLAVNVIGSLALGLLLPLLENGSPALRAGLTVGLCGGFTTFSTFGFETAQLLESGRLASAASYAAASLVLSVVAIFVGLGISRSLLHG